MHLDVELSPFLFSNDNNTRHFVCLPLRQEHELDVNKLVHAADATLKCFQQPCYYDDPYFHISIASFADPSLTVVEEGKEGYGARAKKKKEDEEDEEEEEEEEEEEDGFGTSVETIHIKGVECKIGNRHFRYDLDLRAKGKGQGQGIGVFKELFT